MGSKAKYGHKLYAKMLEISPRNGRWWVEPFAGGLNMTACVPKCDGPRMVNDLNKYVIAMFKALAIGWRPPAHVSKELYKICKMGNAPDYLIGYVGINCSYSGKWFAGYADKTLTKIGTTRNYQEEARKNLISQVKNLEEVLLFSGHYTDMQIPDGSLVYCDPPYFGTTGYGHAFDHNAFWDWCTFLSKRCEVYVSEYVAPENVQCVLELPATSSLSSNGKVGGAIKTIERLYKVAA